jgi:hypothetical protein
MLFAILAAAGLQSTGPCTGAGYDDFDFWLGEWAVYGKDGQRAGTNVIERVEGGCLVTESWTAASGSTGQSYNYYDPHDEQWRQLWVSKGLIIDYVGGLDADGSMALEGTIVYHNRPGTAHPFRGHWTLQDDGTVMQSFHQYNAETERWDEWFVGRYVPLVTTE